MEAAICCGRERLVERSQKVHGAAKAGDDPAGTDAGSRPLTMDKNWQVGRCLDPVRFLQGWRKVVASGIVQLESCRFSEARA